MKPRLELVLLGFLALITFYSCTRSSSTTPYIEDDQHVFVPNDSLPPQLTIFTPNAYEVFGNGSQVHITGKVTDDYGLYRGTIRVVDDATGLALLHQPYEIHGLFQYNFSLNHIIAVTRPSNYTVIVSFEDHGSNSVTQSVKIMANP